MLATQTFNVDWFFLGKHQIYKMVITGNSQTKPQNKLAAVWYILGKLNEVKIGIATFLVDHGSWEIDRGKLCI